MGEITKWIVNGILFIVTKCWKLLVVLVPIAALAWGIYSIMNGREIQSLPLPNLYPPIGR